jgi:hypothetical protein
MNKPSIEIAKKYVELLYNGKYELVSGYEYNLSICKWRCKKHGALYQYQFQAATTRKSCGCLDCRKESGVKKIGKFLKTKYSTITDYSSDTLSASKDEKYILWFKAKSIYQFGMYFDFVNYDFRGRGKHLYVTINCSKHGIFHVKGSDHLLLKYGGCNACAYESQSESRVKVKDGCKKCPSCGITKQVSEFQKAGKLKSGKHRYGLCIECDRRKGEKHRANMSDKQKARYRSLFAKHRAAYRSRLEAVIIDDINIKTVFDRDKWTCKMCGCKTIQTNKILKNKATIDHIIPLSKGGVHSYSNVQTLCFSCNSSKGDRLKGQLVMQL